MICAALADPFGRTNHRRPRNLIWRALACAVSLRDSQVFGCQNSGT